MLVVEIEAGENLCLAPAAPLRHVHSIYLLSFSGLQSSDHSVSKVPLRHGDVAHEVVTNSCILGDRIVLLVNITPIWPISKLWGQLMASRPCNPIRRSRPPVDTRACGPPVLGGSTQGK